MPSISIDQNHDTIISILKEQLSALKELLSQNYRALEVHSPKEEETWLHTEDVMKIFKKSEKTIYNWRQSKNFRCKMMGGTMYYLKSDVYKLA